MKQRCVHLVMIRGLNFPRRRLCTRLATKNDLCAQHQPEAIAERERKKLETAQQNFQRKKNEWHARMRAKGALP